MPRTIHKYPLVVAAEQSLMLPEGAIVLAIQLQRGSPVLWAEVPRERAQPLMQDFPVYAVGTGQTVPDDARMHIGTLQFHNGDLVLHFYMGEPT